MDANKIREIRIIRVNPRFRRYPEYKESGVEWIGEIPQDWEMRKIIHTQSDLVGGVWGNEPAENESDIYCIRVADFNYVQLTISTHNLTVRNMPLKEIDKRILRTDDLLIEKSGGGEKSPVGKIVMFNAEIPRRSVTSNFISKFTVKSDSCFPKYLLYCLCFFYQIGLTRKHIKQTTGIQNLDIDSYFQERIPLPSLVEQTQIVNFLDRKTGQIDELIRIKERRIELLQAQRTALINQAVTKGLDPNVEMKPSGVEWIGVIPAHWNAVPLTKYLESIIDYRGRTPEKTEDGRFLITAKNIRDGQIDYEISQEFTSEDEYQRIMTRGIPQIGDVLFTTEAPLGEVANVDDVSIALAQRIIKFRPKPDFLNPYFLKYWILSYSFQSDLQRYATGSTAKGIKASKLCLLKLNLPPLKEQKQIASFLDCKTQQIDELIAAEHRKIELLKEYRQSLISEAVTGKIDVRNEV